MLMYDVDERYFISSLIFGLFTNLSSCVFPIFVGSRLTIEIRVFFRPKISFRYGL